MQNWLSLFLLLFLILKILRYPSTSYACSIDVPIKRRSGKVEFNTLSLQFSTYAVIQKKSGQGRSKDADIENGLEDTVGEGEAGMK